MTQTLQPTDELSRRAIGALIREIGLSDTVKFLRLSTPGRGNYTEERDALFAGKTVDDLVKEIEEMRQQRAAAKPQ
jgi:hypothetical protein